MKDSLRQRKHRLFLQSKDPARRKSLKTWTEEQKDAEIRELWIEQAALRKKIEKAVQKVQVSTVL